MKFDNVTKERKIEMKVYKKLAMAGLFFAAAVGVAGCAKKDSAGFTPRLDTQNKVVLGTTGFFGNFEALDMVTDDFNKYYPNVEFSYDQINSDNYEDYLLANPTVDILMTSDEVFHKFGDSVVDVFADLTDEDIDLGSIDKDMLYMSYCDGKLISIPMGQNIYGLVVNVTLLKNEGLSVPQNYDEFINVLAALKEKGYTPIQGADSKVYAELTENMLYDMLLTDKALYADLMAGSESAVDALMPVADKLEYIIDNGFTDLEVNRTYPSDNYDKAILTFFEGNVPFWVCNTEKVSGMKKRESKSESFAANPFEYTYIYAPLGEKGAYAYREPWLGFAVNKNSDKYEYAVEFMRFLATEDEINKIADIKGVPSVAVRKNDVAVYHDILNTRTVEMDCVNDGSITPAIISNWYTSVNQYASGTIDTTRAAMEYFVELCSQAQENGTAD